MPPSPIYSSCDYNTYHHFEINGNYTIGKALRRVLRGRLSARQAVPQHSVLVSSTSFDLSPGALSSARPALAVC